MKTTKAKELREMAADKLEATHKDAIEQMFRLRLRSQTERLDTASELRRLRRLIARIETLKAERALAALEGLSATDAAAAVQTAKTTLKDASDSRKLDGPRWSRRLARRAFVRAKAAAASAAKKAPASA